VRKPALVYLVDIGVNCYLNVCFVYQIRLGTAPVVAIAGFFRPDLMLFGNPEMDRIELIKWAYNQVSSGQGH